MKIKQKKKKKKNEQKNQGKPQAEFSYRAETDQKPMSYSDNNAKQIQQ